MEPSPSPGHSRARAREREREHVRERESMCVKREREEVVCARGKGGEMGTEDDDGEEKGEPCRVTHRDGDTRADEREKAYPSLPRLPLEHR